MNDLESAEEEIRALAQQANDPKDRAYLLLQLRVVSVLSGIYDKLETHVEQFSEHRTDFAKHVTDEAALFNQGRGAWRVTAVVLAIMQAVGLGAIGWYVRAHDADRDAVRQIAISVIQLQQQQAHNADERAEIKRRIERLETKNYGTP